MLVLLLLLLVVVDLVAVAGVAPPRAGRCCGCQSSGRCRQAASANPYRTAACSMVGSSANFSHG
jgi:hypothetical protein